MDTTTRDGRLEMKRGWLVYLLLDRSGAPMYIGVTFDMGRRLGKHRHRFGFLPDYKVLEKGTGDRRAAEHRWIETYRLEGVPLLNKTVGGNGGEVPSMKTRRLISRRVRAHRRTPEHCRNIAAAKRGRKRPDVSERNRSQNPARRGRKMCYSAKGLKTKRQEGRKLASKNRVWLSRLSAKARKLMAERTAASVALVWANRSKAERERISAAISAARRRSC